MPVDVVTEIVIERPRDVVAAYAGDPTNAPEWYANIQSVRWHTDPPVVVGSRMDFVEPPAMPPPARGFETAANRPDSPGSSHFMSSAVRRANRRDLARLKEALERAGA
jgi:hypothetical protein